EPPKRSQNQVYTEAVRILSLLYNKCLPLQEAGKNLDSSLKSKTVEKACGDVRRKTQVPIEKRMFEAFLKYIADKEISISGYDSLIEKVADIWNEHQSGNFSMYEQRQLSEFYWEEPCLYPTTTMAEALDKIGIEIDAEPKDMTPKISIESKTILDCIKDINRGGGIISLIMAKAIILSLIDKIKDKHEKSGSPLCAPDYETLVERVRGIYNSYRSDELSYSENSDIHGYADFIEENSLRSILLTESIGFIFENNGVPVISYVEASEETEVQETASPGERLADNIETILFRHTGESKKALGSLTRSRIYEGEWPIHKQTLEMLSENPVKEKLEGNPNSDKVRIPGTANNGSRIVQQKRSI
ncbi:MAG: hypothetical protein ABIH83_03565, partial [Candidatus Micrarchaeota archaeon]